MLTIVTGKMGSGKTAYAVARAMEEFQNGGVVISNIHLSFRHQGIDALSKAIRGGYKLKNAIVIIDMAEDNYSKMVKTISSATSPYEFAKWARKQSIEILFIAQRASNLHISILQVCDRILTCKFNSERKMVVLKEKLVKYVGNAFACYSMPEMYPEGHTNAG